MNYTNQPISINGMYANGKINYLVSLFKNEVLMLFARSNHPKGYGYADGTAHGYSIVAVSCPPDYDKMDQVVRKMNTGFYGTVSIAQINNNEFYNGDKKEFGNLRDWYGGQFDLIAVYAGVGKYIGRAFYRGYDPQYQVDTLGDNRAFSRFSYEEVINN